MKINLPFSNSRACPPLEGIGEWFLIKNSGFLVCLPTLGWKKIEI